MSEILCPVFFITTHFLGHSIIQDTDCFAQNTLSALAQRQNTFNIQDLHLYHVDRGRKIRIFIQEHSLVVKKLCLFRSIFKVSTTTTLPIHGQFFFMGRHTRTTNYKPKIWIAELKDFLFLF